MNDDRLAELLHEAVADVEPADRIADIRARTVDPTRSAARPWFYAAGAAVLATAAAVGAFAVLGDDPSSNTGPAHNGHEERSFLVPAYFIGDTPQGERLYREFDAAKGHDELDAALARIQEPAADPDYRTPWQPGSFESVTLGEGTIDIEVGTWTEYGADELPIQQVVYTLRGAAELDWPVRFLQDGEPMITVDAMQQNDVLSLVSISDPSEGTSYGDTFYARGRANSFEATVPWEIREGDTVVRSGFATADGTADRLYAWEAQVEIDGLDPGEYTFVAMTSDPSGGTEGFGPFVDTRTIVVR